MVACTAAFTGFGCGGGDLVLPNTRAPAELAIESGDLQTGTAGALLADPLVVRVTDAADRAVEGAEVEFSTTGDGELIPSIATTGADGRATARWTLGRTAGTQRASARVAGGDAAAELTVTFTASASDEERPRLAVITQPSSSARSGTAFGRQPRVRVEEIDSDERDGIAVVAALATGVGTLRGTTRQVTGNSGVAEFTDLSIEGPPGSYTLVFSAAGIDGAVSAPIEITAASSPSTIRILEHSPDPSAAGQAVRVRVVVAAASGGGTPGGSFTVTASTGEGCSGEVGAGSCDITFNSTGTRTLVARYAGDADFQESQSEPVSHTVIAAPVIPTRTTTGSAPDPSRAGAAVTIFVTVRGSSGERPPGIVRIYDQSPACGAGTLMSQVELNDDGRATFTTTQLAVGFHVIRACYMGTAGFAPSDDVATQVITN